MDSSQAPEAPKEKNSDSVVVGTATPLQPIRNGNGTFSKGGRGGPGSAIGAKALHFKSLILAHVSDEDFIEMLQAQVAKAKNGDSAAFKEILDRLLGKPAQAVNIGDSEGQPLTLRIIREEEPAK